MNGESPQEPLPGPKALKRPLRLLLLGLGHLAFGLGLLGLFIPLLPTTVFWIIAVACYARSAPHLKARILAWPSIGPMIGDYLDKGLLNRRAKIGSIGSIALVAVLVTVLTPPPPYVLSPLLAFFGLLCLYLATRPERLK